MKSISDFSITPEILIVNIMLCLSSGAVFDEMLKISIVWWNVEDYYLHDACPLQTMENRGVPDPGSQWCT